MIVFNINSHLEAIIESSCAALLICNELPDTDSVLELKDILGIQCDILNDYVKGNHYGSRALEEFTNSCKQRCSELENENQ